jgi:hypothetical protein
MQESSKKIHEKLEKMYQDSKSKNFVLHLIRSYLPVDKTKKVFMKPENMKNFKCVLTDVKLISIDEIFEIIQSEEYNESFIQDLKFNTGLQEKPADYQPTMLKLAKGRIMGFQGEDTTTYMCQEAVQCLFDWVSVKILNGDGKINWTVRQMKTDAFTSKFKEFKDPETEKQVKRIKEITKNPKKAKTTLGDFDILKELKDKLENNEK